MGYAGSAVSFAIAAQRIFDGTEMRGPGSVRISQGRIDSVTWGEAEARDQIHLPADAMALWTSAGFLGLGSELGRIVPGYRADLVAFDPGFDVVGTWIGGAGSTGEGGEASHRG